MEKIQTDVVSMIQAAMKAGSSYQTSDVGAAFDKMLKERNQAADSKTQDVADSGQETPDIGKNETKPVKESGKKEKTEDSGENDSLKNGDIVPSELLLQIQETAGQMKTVVPEEISGISDQQETVLDPLAQPEQVLEAAPEQVLETVPQQEDTIPAETELITEETAAAMEPEDSDGTGYMAVQAESLNGAETEKLQSGEAAAGETDKADIVKTVKPQEHSEAAPEPENVPQAKPETVSRAEEGDTEKQAGQEQQFSGIAEQPREYAAPKMAQSVSEPVRTSEPTLVNDVGRAIAQRFPADNGTLTIELEPASLGKLTIHVLYESGKATVSILSTNARTLELLNTKAAELASILEERTGQETVIVAEQPAEEQPFDERQGGGQRNEQQESREHKEKTDQDSFLQQLRLGFI